MKHIILYAISAAIVLTLSATPVQGDTALEDFVYSQDFETGELSAWALYPLWQDTAYDPNFRVNTIVPGDPNISIEQAQFPRAITKQGFAAWAITRCNRSRAFRFIEPVTSIASAWRTLPIN